MNFITEIYTPKSQMPPKSIDSKLNEHHGNSSNMLSEESMEFIHKTNQLVV